jgi:hypothetical protein
MKYFSLILIVVLYIGCKKDSVTSPGNVTKIISLNDTSEVGVGQTVSLTGSELVFRFDSVINDSRCPIGLECFWQGNASIHLTFPERIDTLDTIFKQVLTYGNYKILFIDLLPYPIWQQPIDKNSYRAKLKVIQ